MPVRQRNDSGPVPYGGAYERQHSYRIKQLVTAGVRLFFYLEDRERTFDTPIDKIMLQLTNFADEMERERAKQRTYDAMLRKAKAGHVTGGSVFGYDNVEIAGTVPDAQGRLKRSHVEFQINEGEAEVVRRIFRLYAEGQGFTSIAKALNAEGAICPRPRPSLSKPHGWVSSSVRQVLLRRLYIGEQVWGKTKKRTPWGIKKAQRRAEQDWIVIPVPQLRIVSGLCLMSSGRRSRSAGRISGSCISAPPTADCMAGQPMGTKPPTY